ncbi:MAG: prephenate dehydrogenase [Spirochaetales bacterium]|nr:prephenate dehydrogenase [Spirochaetales bacterium]
MIFPEVLIYGMGMMGASLAHALRQQGCSVDGVVRTQTSQKEIERLNLARQVLLSPQITLEQFDDYDLIVLCIPIAQELELLARLKGRVLITNISSTAAAARQYYNSPLRFVASHPMCGSDLSGPQAFVPDLYAGKLCFIIDGANQAEDQEKISAFWQSIGMKTFAIGAADHDSMLAYVSHGPHILSSLLVHWARPALRYAEGSPLGVTGGGFKDMARIAGSNPEMWASIIESNKEELRRALLDFEQSLHEVLTHLDDGPEFWIDFQKKARLARDELYG